MKNLLTCLALLSSFSLSAQYYFNDLVSAREITRQMKTYSENNVRKVIASGFNPMGQKNTEFSEIHEVLDNKRVLRIIDQNPVLTTSSYRFDNNGNLVSITDSSSDVTSVTQYAYDANNRIIMVQNTLKDSASDFTQKLKRKISNCSKQTRNPSQSVLI